MMTIRLNGESYETNAENVHDLLRELDIPPGRVAVEVNLGIIKGKDHLSTPLKAGDQVEVVNFVGGGAMRRIAKNG